MECILIWARTCININYNKFFLPFASCQDIADNEEQYMHELYLFASKII